MTTKTAASTQSKKSAPGSSDNFNFNTENSAEGLGTSIRNHLRYTFAHDPGSASDNDWWNATCLAVRDRLLDKAARSRKVHSDKNVRRVYYLSLEYLMGRLLENNLRNLEIFEAAREALASFGKDIDAIADKAPDMGLGNGGLGRLAACFLDSLTTLDLPSVGYGIYYEFGLFRQTFEDDRQVEKPDEWRRYGTPWGITRPEYAVDVRLYGHVEKKFDEFGQCHIEWVGGKEVRGVPHDIPIAGFRTDTVNVLRLWQSTASEDFNLDVFNQGGYVDAVREKALNETISKVLYPNDTTESGKELRLVQQYFFVACSIRDLIRRHFFCGRNDWSNFADKVAIQLNDTHPAVAVPELMRILLDEVEMEWQAAWDLCQRVFSYTNHTLLPEALERWSVPLFGRVLPRHLEIILEINRRFLEHEVDKRWPGDDAKKRLLSLIEEGHPQMIRMANLSVIGSHTTNGVAALHSRLLKEKLFPELDALYPNRFDNKTNGITPRRWLLSCNPALAELVSEICDDDWPRRLIELRKLGEHADDHDFQDRFMAIKRANKEALARVIERDCGITVDPDALFDVQIKRLHEYKRQHLNLLHILTLYRRLLQNPDLDIVPRVFIFAAKAAPGYTLAKDIIHAINSVGRVINNDPKIKGKLKVAFLSNYSVSLAEKIIPAADLSEQISTAGKEASGTGNMKLALNGAVTIGTLDGANVEIMEEVGKDNIFIFGLTVEQVDKRRLAGYNPYDVYWQDEELRAIIDWLASSFFTGSDDLRPVRDSLLDGGDPFLALADYRSYIECQEKVDAAFRDHRRWAKMAILNTALVGKFSSDRTIQEYADEIWQLPQVPVS